MKTLTVKDYAAIMGVSTAAVTMACKDSKKLIGIAAYQKIGRDWQLEPLPPTDPPTVYEQGKIIDKNTA